MALRALSLFVYGLEVTTLNQNLDFESDLDTFLAVLTPGFYSPGSLAIEVARAMNDADGANNYT